MSIVIDKIVFENFRQYGSGYLSFNNDGASKLSVLIAKNGTGKTTLLNSITWCLYEKEQQLTDKKSALPVVSSAKLEEAEKGAIIPVSVAVTIIDGDQVIEFKRSQKFKKNIDKRGAAVAIANTSVLTVSTTIKGEFENTVIDCDLEADIKVKKYFDPAIYNFYFFDGEQLRDFFAPDRSGYIKGSIYNIAQVTLLQNAFNHVDSLRAEKMRSLGKNNPDITELIESLDEFEKQKGLDEQTINVSSERQRKLEQKRDRADEILRGYAPIKRLQEERSRLESELRRCDNDRKKLISDRADFIRKYIVLIKLYPSMKNTLDVIKEKEANGDLPPAIDKAQIKRVLAHIDEPCPLCAGKIGESERQHLESLLNQISVSSKTSNYLKEIKGSLETYVEEVYKYHDTKELLKQREMDINEHIQQIEIRLKEINAILVNYSDESGTVNVSNVEKERASLQEQINNAIRTISAAEASIKTCDSQIASLQKKLDEAQKKLGIKNTIKSQIRVLVKMEDYFKIKDNITDSMRKEIETTTWNIFDAMIWKRNTFGRIEISDNYEVSVYNKEDVLMTGSLSATEQMALAYSFTLAIHKASGKNCPLVIDSPLGRVSDENRENMARALLKISRDKQIIMLFTPDEYSASVESMYEGNAHIRRMQLSENEKFVEGIEY